MRSVSSRWVSPQLLPPPGRLGEAAGIVAWLKPAGTPLLPATGGGPGADLATRLWRAEQVPRPTVPQLEGAASGVVLFGLPPEAIVALESDAACDRAVRRTFVGAIAPPDSLPRRLRGAVSGRMTEAIVRPLERGDRGLLIEVVLTKGRPGPLRGLLRERGLALAGGDSGPPAHRLMWQLRSIELGEQRFEAPLDPDLVAFVRGARRDLRARLEQAVERRAALAAAAPGTDAFRVVNGEGDAIPGIELDRYGAYAVVHLRSEALVDDPEALLDWLDDRGASGTYVIWRPKDSSALTDAERERHAPPRPIRGTAAPDPLIIHENGVSYAVRLGHGLATGIFLDQRANRRRIFEGAPGKRVLNLFGYTGAFSVAAAAGGALESLTVDVGAPAARAAEEALAPYRADAHRSIRADVFAFLARDPSSILGRFDWVVCDPPTFARAGSRRWASGRDWIPLGERLLHWVKPEGRLLVCSNDRRMSEAAFQERWLASARRAGVEICIQAHPPPPDFPPSPGQRPHLKTLEVRIQAPSGRAVGRGRRARNPRG